MKRILKSIGIQRSLRRLGLALLSATLLVQNLFAQSGTNATPSNRWLVIVDTSQAQKRRAESVGRVTAGLLMSGMHGQMLPGDTVGVWTYNDKVHSGELPLQEWTPDTARLVTERVFKFLNKQKFENEGNLDNVMSELDRLVKSSDFITAIIISDGSSEIHFTPFDEKINLTYKSWNKELPEEQRLFVTLLRASHGKFTHYAVNMPPWPFETPPLPAELLAVKTNNEIAKQQENAPKPIVYGPSLIISGKKPAAATQTVAQVTSETTTNPPPQPEKAAEALGTLTAHARTTPIPEPAEPAAQPQSVVAVLLGIWSDHKILVIGGTAAGALVLGWIALRLRQSRNTGPISLTGRSLDRENQ